MAPELVIRDCTVADSRGQRPERVDITIGRGSILEIRPAVRAAPPMYEAEMLIDGSGVTVVPGLINAHEHLGVVHPGTYAEHRLARETPSQRFGRMGRNAARALRAGVTGLRLVGERDGLDLVLREASDGRPTLLPRIWTAGRPLDFVGAGRGFVGAIECATAEDFGRAARSQIARGADLVKLMISGGLGGADRSATHVTVGDFSAVRDAARASGLRIAVHTAGARHPIIDTLIDEGVDSLEHCYCMEPETVERCARSGVLLVLTPLIGRVPDYLSQIGLPPETVRRMTDAGETHWLAVCAAIASGARVALGTDLHSHDTIQGASAVVRELELYEEAGATPAEVLAIASRNVAVWLGVGDRLGLVEEGFDADLLLLDESPFDRGAAAFRRIRQVISRGFPLG